ncbi:MAG: RNA-binding S4 domain-containing protein [Tissierellia bacterium]|nr:RNA-binding S4 domain-containing protein [Tissierellia bacterium]
MRLDKYLKNTRLIKRRTVAKEACDQGRVSINNQVAKAGSEVAVGDQIDIHFGNHDVRIQVVQVKENVGKKEADQLYRLID